MTQSIKEQLYESFDNIKSRKGRGGTYDYVSWKNVVDRMNEVFGMNWSSEAVSEVFNDERVLIRVRVCATNPENGEIFCQEGYGGADVRGGDEAGNPHKSAYSKALKDACKKWGIGLWLDEDSISTYTNQGSYSPPSQGPQGLQVPTPRGQAPQAPSGGAPKVPSGGFSPPQGPAPKAPQAPQGPAPQAPQGPAPQAPQGPAPKAPQAPQGPAPQAPSGGFNPPMSPTSEPKEGPPNTQGGTIDPAAPGSLTNVQEMAIKNLLCFVEDTDIDTLIQRLAQDPAYNIRNNPAPKLDDLTYNEAVSVIKSSRNLK